MFLRSLTAGTILATMVAFGAHAQDDYPNQPIRVVVAFAAGGSTDIVTRTVADKMSQMLGQPIVIENRGGADGNVAAEYGADLPADGYNLIATTNSITINLNLYQQTYHPVDDFDPIVQFGDGPNVIVVHPSVKAETMEELVEISQENPLFFATTASGTWLATELFKQSTGLKGDRVPFSGAGTAVPAVLGGEVDMMLTGVINVLPHIQSGGLRPIVVTSQERTDLLPDVPAISEFGLTEYNDAVWYGLIAPEGTPKPIIDKLNAPAREAMKDPEVRAKLEALSVVIKDESPEEFAELIDKDIARWEKLIKETGAKLD